VLLIGNAELGGIDGGALLDRTLERAPSQQCLDDLGRAKERSRAGFSEKCSEALPSLE